MQKENENIPIILTAFGTTAKAFATYEKMDQVFQQTFPNKEDKHPLQLLSLLRKILV